MNKLVALAALLALPALAHAAPHSRAQAEQVVVRAPADSDYAYSHLGAGAAVIPVAPDGTLPNGVSVLDSQEN